MSQKIQTEVWESAELKGNAKLVLLLLADNADEVSRECWPGHTYIAERVRISEKTVGRIIAQLISDGFIIEHRKATGRSSTHYRITKRDHWTYEIFDGSEF